MLEWGISLFLGGMGLVIAASDVFWRRYGKVRRLIGLTACLIMDVGVGMIILHILSYRPHE